MSSRRSLKNTVRRGVSSDAFRISLVHTSTWSATYPLFGIPVLDPDKNLKLWTSVLADPRCCLWVSEQDSIEGFVSTLHKDSTVYISALYVLPEHQRSGIGTLLIRKALQEASSGTTLVRVGVLEQNQKARRFYEAMGFKYQSTEPVDYFGLQLQEAKYEWGTG